MSWVSIHSSHDLIRLVGSVEMETGEELITNLIELKY